MMNNEKDKEIVSSDAGKSNGKPETGENPVSETIKSKIIQIKRGIWRKYDATHGLPAAPYRLLQDRQGYLWIGTDIGLCRYDGAEFITYPLAHNLAGTWVNALCEDHEGKLWMGAGGGMGTGGLSCFDGKQYTTYTVADGLAGNNVWDLCVDNQGKLWIGTEKGLSCFYNRGFVNYTIEDGLPRNSINSLCQDKQGRLWIGTYNGLSCFDGRHFTNYTTADGLPDNRVNSLCMDGHGKLWFWSYDKGVSCFDGKNFKTYTPEYGLIGRQHIFMAIYSDHQGRMWFGGWAGVSCFDGERFVNYPSKERLSPGPVFDMIEDREGQFWFANTASICLTCFDENTMQLLTDQPSTWAADQDKSGRLWFNSIDDIYAIRLDSTSSEVEQRKIPFNIGIIGVMVDSGDRLWVNLVDVYRYDSADMAWESAVGESPYEPRHFKNNAMPLLELKDGSIWFRIKGQLSRFHPERFTDEDPIESIDANPGIVYPIEDRQGRLWIGGQGTKGLICREGDKLTTYTQENGLPDNRVRSLLEDSDGNIWIGTERGLCCYDGKQFITYGAERGLRDLFHWDSVKDIFGQLWFATKGGICLTDGKHFQWLTEDDGLPSNNISGLLPQPDGSMIICTSGGIVRYHLTATLPPRISIREVVADKVYQDPDEIELTTTAANLITMSYHSLSLATRRMRYGYILEGYDGGWCETWERQARYENLPIGDYTFKVIAINRDLVTSETPAILKLKVVSDPRDLMLKELQSDLSVKNRQLTFLQREMGRKYQFENIIGKSKEIELVRNMMDRAIDSGLNVLITGETGTGKELVAKGIHYNSSRKDKLMIPFNCGAVPKELINSELFGHVKGAFTGAIEDKMGLFEVANGSTLALDEIGEMPMDVQVNLLRVLQGGEISRLGRQYEIRKVDVKIIAMTNRDLTEEIKAGRFRQDLYYRLNRFKIHVPPLRDRREDIPLLAEYFYQEAYQEQRKNLKGFFPGVIEMLKDYSWPGNVRELQNEINRAYALAEKGTAIQIYHFSPDVVQNESLAHKIMSAGLNYTESVKQFRRQLVERALQESNGNRTQAARLLGMGRSNLIHLIKDLELEKPRRHRDTEKT